MLVFTEFKDMVSDPLGGNHMPASCELAENHVEEKLTADESLEVFFRQRADS
jgi:hypothetical protein